MEQAHTSWVAKTWALPRKVVTAGIVQAKKRHRQLTTHYGAKYTYAIVVVLLIAVYLPIPGIVLGSAALGFIVVIAEVHRAISKRRDRLAAEGRFATAVARKQLPEDTVPHPASQDLSWPGVDGLTMRDVLDSYPSRPR
jgi:hypothetical protein